MRLNDLPLNQSAAISGINWAVLDNATAARLRAFGFDTGANIKALHYGGGTAHDPIAFRIGRMTIAIRRALAAAILVETL